MDKTAIQTHVERLWDQSILPELTEYIRIPNKTPAFDPEWRTHGYIEQGVARVTGLAQRPPIKGRALEVVRLEGRTPLLLIDIPGASSICVFLYGHMDKQPE